MLVYGFIYVVYGFIYVAYGFIDVVYGFIYAVYGFMGLLMLLMYQAAFLSNLIRTALILSIPYWFPLSFDNN